jgi:hypothetical protein
MLCSACSRSVRPVVAVDIDGTLGNYHAHFLNFLEEYIGWAEPRPFYIGAEGFKEWCMDMYGVSEATWKDAKLAYRQGAQKRSMPIFPWAQVLTGIVRWEGAELWVTTTRPYLRLDNIDPDTREWLARNGIEYDGLIYDKYKYKLLAEQVDPERVVAVVEDLEDKIEEARHYFGAAVPIRRQTEYNVGARRFLCGMSSDDLREVTAVIVQRINRWKELHR